MAHIEEPQKNKLCMNRYHNRRVVPIRWFSGDTLAAFEVEFSLVQQVIDHGL